MEIARLFEQPNLPNGDKLNIKEIDAAKELAEHQAETHAHEIVTNDATVHHLFAPLPPRKRGRPAKPRKVVMVTESFAPTTVAPTTVAPTFVDLLQRFLAECFVLDPEGTVEASQTLVTYVRHRLRLWYSAYQVSLGKTNNAVIKREETNALSQFFQDRFQVVQKFDRGMKSSFYKGLTMKPWAPEIGTESDVDRFVRDVCEVHVMGRARAGSEETNSKKTESERMDTIFGAFNKWSVDAKGAVPTDADWKRFITALKRSPFVYHTGVAVARDAVGASGVYGLYLKTATDECRDVGYNRSPNTRSAILKLDALGNVVDIIDSQNEFAKTVMKRSSEHACHELTRCFNDGMKGVLPGDGYCYMRAKDHETLLGSRGATLVAP